MRWCVDDRMVILAHSNIVFVLRLIRYFVFVITIILHFIFCNLTRSSGFVSKLNSKTDQRKWSLFKIISYYADCDFCFVQNQYHTTVAAHRKFNNSISFSDNPFEGFTFHQSCPLSYSLRDHRNANLDNFTDFHWIPMPTTVFKYYLFFSSSWFVLNRWFSRDHTFNFQSNLHGNPFFSHRLSQRARVCKSSNRLPFSMTKSKPCVSTNSFQPL